MERNYWLMKSEPEDFGIDHLEKVKKEPWTGVRNFQARNFMRDEMQVGDGVLFYHSSTKPGVYGIAEVASEPYSDPTQFDTSSNYYERRATKEKPIWFLVDVRFIQKLKRPVLISELRTDQYTRDMQTLRQGNRLSITPVIQTEFDRVLLLGNS